MVNEYMPRTFGDGVIHESHIDAMVEHSEPLHELKRGALSEEEESIGKLIAENLVVDGATLQMGIELHNVYSYMCLKSVYYCVLSLCTTVS
jgi:acyl-CoA hydrolase